MGYEITDKKVESKEEEGPWVGMSIYKPWREKWNLYFHYIFRRLKPYLINRSYGLPGTAAAKSRQSCPTLCDPIDGSPPGSCPWDSPGKNTGVGCHFLLQCMKVKSESEVDQLCPTLRDPMDWSPSGSSIHGIFQARVLEWGAIAFSEQRLLKHHQPELKKRNPSIL